MPRRLFFALWPDPLALQQIKHILKYVAWPRGAKLVPEVDRHMTLSFLGSTTEAQYQQLLPSINQIKGHSFSLCFDQLVYWSKVDMLLLEASVLPEPLLNLVDTLNRALKEQSWKLDSKPFKAHVTLARRFSDPLPDAGLTLGKLDFPVTFHVHEFCLVDSALRHQGQAKHYHILRCWSLDNE